MYVNKKCREIQRAWLTECIEISEGSGMRFNRVAIKIIFRELAKIKYALELAKEGRSDG